MAGSNPATGCRRSAALPMSARLRSRPRAAFTPSCCAAAWSSAKSGAARSFPDEARRGVSAPPESRGARIDLEINYPLLPNQSALIAKSLEGLDRPEALEAALRQGSSAGTSAARSISADFLSRKRLAGTRRADRVHRQRPAVHCRCPFRDRAARRPLRRRGADLSLHQGHRRPARRDAGAAGHGRTRRAAGRGAESPPRSASCRTLHPADDSESAGHHDAGLTARRSVARCREARPHRDRRFGLRLPR